MASISEGNNGRRSIQFVAGDGKRRTIRLGKVSKANAQSIKLMVEALNASVISGLPIDGETAAWLRKIGNDLADKLAGVGLIASRKSAGALSLGKFLEDYIVSRPDVKPATLTAWNTHGQRLMAFFGAGKPLDGITPGDADAFKAWLQRKPDDTARKGLAAATVGRCVKFAAQIFRAAARRKLIAESPFADVKGPSQANAERAYFVSREDTDKVLESCPDAEWRAIVALCRYGGLRCPSEVLALTWDDVDWERSRFRVTSSKTEHHEGKGERWVPLFPELRTHLEDAFEQAAEGAVFVIARHRGEADLANGAERNWRTRFLKIVRRAGLTPWPRLFQNLRSTRETELVTRHPLHVVTAWIGNSAAIAAKHYLQVTDADFELASKSGAESGAEAVQIPVHHADSRLFTDVQVSAEGVENQTFTNNLEHSQTSTYCTNMGAEGLEPHANSPQKTHFSRNRAAECGALFTDLDFIIARWPTLTPEVRAAILALVDTPET